MKQKNYDWEDLSKKKKDHIMDDHSGISEQPPSFSLSNGSNSEQTIQAMFPNSQKMGIDSGFPDVSKLPYPTAPVPLPYPMTGDLVPPDKSIKPLDMNPFSQHGAIPFGSMMGGGMGNMNNGGMGFMGPGGLFGTPSAKPMSITVPTSDYVEKVQEAHTSFKKKAYFSNINIESVSAIGHPGCLNGPDLSSLIGSKMSKYKGDNKKMGDAVAEGVGENFNDWKNNVMVPGLPWYPSFASYPGAYAPPTPNVPVSLSACVSNKLEKITVAKNLYNSIWDALPSDLQVEGNKPYVKELAQSLATFFISWVMGQMVMNVLGQGPVPTYAPPAVTAGPVVGGHITAIPTHLP